MSPASPGTAAGTQSRAMLKGSLPHWRYPASVFDDGGIGPTNIRERLAPDTHGGSKQGGIYGSAFEGTAVYGYQHKNMANNPPLCEIDLGTAAVNDIAVDTKGDLIIPQGASVSGQRAVSVYQGPGMCGKLVGTLVDPYGQPSDATSEDAVNGTIVVSNIFGIPSGTKTEPGSISICTLSSGTCSKNLTNPNIYEAAGVARNHKNDCWSSAVDSSAKAHLIYFAHCKGAGQDATGFLNSSYGGLDIDKQGNLVSIDKLATALYVYKGCNPACTLVGGPFTLHGQSVFGKLNRQSMTFAAADRTNASIDVYLYSPTSLTYWYSFNASLGTYAYKITGVAQNPRSKE